MFKGGAGQIFARVVVILGQCCQEWWWKQIRYKGDLRGFLTEALVCREKRVIDHVQPEGIHSIWHDTRLTSWTYSCVLLLYAEHKGQLIQNPVLSSVQPSLMCFMDYTGSWLRKIPPLFLGQHVAFLVPRFRMPQNSCRTFSRRRVSSQKSLCTLAQIT